MSGDHKAWLLINLDTGKEAIVRLAAFHEVKWLNTWIRERNENVDPTPKTFEKLVENTPVPRTFSDLLHSSTPHAHNVQKEQENLHTPFVSGRKCLRFLKRASSKISHSGTSTHGTLRSQVERNDGHWDAHTYGMKYTVRPVIKLSDNVFTRAKRLVIVKAIYESHLNGDVLASRSTVSFSPYSVKVSPG